MGICFDSGRFDEFNNTKYFSLMDREMWFTYICEKYKIKITDIEKALDKDTPKKVIFIIPQKYGELDVKYKCPNCHVALLPIPFGSVYIESYKHCFNCGQKLDWSKDD